MSEIQKNMFIMAGIQASTILSSYRGIAYSFEEAIKCLYQPLQPYIYKLRLYMLDLKNEFFIEEIIITDHLIQKGYDVIPINQMSTAVTSLYNTREVNDGSNHFLFIPLVQDNRLIGFMELASLESFDKSLIENIVDMGKAFSLGVNFTYFKKGAAQSKLYYNVSVEIIQKLQSIKNVDEMISTFAHSAVTQLKLDRVTVFIFDNEDGKIIHTLCANCKGEVFALQTMPELPSLSNGIKPLKHLSGYWVPLITNTRTIGLVLFDNAYTSIEIPERLYWVLQPLCNQFASALENVRLFSAVQNAALHDKLTGLYNRAFFEDELARLDKSSQLPLSIIIGDVNGLKMTNDVFGHSEGDKLLKSIAGIFRDTCRSRDLIARWGGDEFIILLPKATEKVADEICERFRKACLDISDTKIQLSVSLGHATKEKVNEDINIVLKNAEDRMYRHKLLESKSFRSSFVSSLKETLLEKCQETSEHIERLDELSMKIGIYMGLTDSELDELKLLATLHDIGKVAISDKILNKPGPLNASEWEEMKKHSEIGYRIAQASSELLQIADYILCHHEKWNGTGYPLGKKGKDIPKLSRIISVIDSYDVMTNARSYKKPMSHSSAIEELVNCSGTQFDPEIVDIFIKLQSEIV